MGSSPNQVYKTAVVLFSGADILDFAGPIEILSHVYYNGERADHNLAFQITQIASTETVLTGGVMKITPNMTFTEGLQKLEDFDIVVVPGGHPKRLSDMAASNGPEIQFIRAFNALGQKGGKDRLILSVCTGALLVGASGALGGLKATTHHMGLNLLKKIDGTIDVVDRKEDEGVGRYVDGGRSKSGVQMVSAGGVTCGLDASLFVAETKAGRAAAEMAARMVEYEWNRP